MFFLSLKRSIRKIIRTNKIKLREKNIYKYIVIIKLYVRKSSDFQYFEHSRYKKRIYIYGI